MVRAAASDRFLKDSLRDISASRVAVLLAFPARVGCARYDRTVTGLNLREQFVRLPMDLRKFRPLWAVTLLTNELEGNTAYLQPWALAQLLAWAILDQRPGKRLHRKSDKTPTSRSSRARAVL
jgi:hypothetical protein